MNPFFLLTQLLQTTLHCYGRHLRPTLEVSSYLIYPVKGAGKLNKVILESKLKRAEEDYAKRSSLSKLKEITALHSALDSLLTKTAEGKIIFARQKNLRAWG